MLSWPSRLSSKVRAPASIWQPHSIPAASVGSGGNADDQSLPTANDSSVPPWAPNPLRASLVPPASKPEAGGKEPEGHTSRGAKD